MLTIYDSSNSGEPHATDLANPGVMSGTAEIEMNVPLAPEEIATLSNLVQRYDRLLLDIDALNDQIEAFLKVENPVTAIEAVAK